MGRKQRQEQQETAFYAMLDRCEGTLVRMCYTFTDRRADHVADLYQDIVAELWSSWPTFRGQSSPRTWALRVALRVASRHVRLRMRQPLLQPCDISCLAHLSDEAADSCYDRLYELIDHLGDSDRKLVFLYLERHPLQEIADILNITEDAVKKRLQRARQRLKTIKQKIYD